MTRERPLSILAVSPVGEAGGAEALLVDTLAGFRKAGVKVVLTVLGPGPLEELAKSHGVPVLVGPPLSFRRPQSVARSMYSVRRAFTFAEPDVVIGSHPKGQLICRLACIGRRFVVYATQLYDPPSRKDVSSRLAAHLPGLRFAITEETAASYRKRNGALDPIVIPPATDRFRLVQAARQGDGEAAWLRAGMDSRGPRIVMAARLQRFKGPFDFIEAAAGVIASRPDARFLIIGPDSPIEPGVRDELSAVIRARHLEGFVALAGRLSANDLAATVRGATVLVHPAHREPFGLAIVEALALGTPVVAYATTGACSILSAGGGDLVPPGDVIRLAEAITRAVDDPALLSRWSAEGHSASARFDLGANVDRYLQVLAEASVRRCRETTPGAITTVGVVPQGPSGVRDYGLLLNEELRRCGFAVEEHWLHNSGDRLRPALRVSLDLVRLAATLPRDRVVIWHYSPVVYGYRGIPGCGVVFGLILRARGCRVVSVLHEVAYTYRRGADPPHAKVKAVSQDVALRSVIAGSNTLVVTTDKRRTALARRIARKGLPVEVIPVFPTIPALGVWDPARDGPFIVGVPGYAGDGVRPDLLINAIARLQPQHPIRVVLLGGPGADSDDGRRWIRLADQQGVRNRVEFTGVVDAAEFSRRLAACDVVVLVNEEGPSSRKTTLAAALSHGVPVISLDGDNRWDQLVQSAAVRLAPPDDAIALSDMLDELLRSSAERSALGKRGAMFASKHMSLPRAAGAFAALLTAVSGHARQSGTCTVTLPSEIPIRPIVDQANPA